MMDPVERTDRMAAPEAWSAALDSIETALILADPVGDRVIQFNEAALEFTGLRGRDLARMRVTALFPGKYADLVGLTLAALAKGNAWSGGLA